MNEKEKTKLGYSITPNFVTNINNSPETLATLRQNNVTKSVTKCKSKTTANHCNTKTKQCNEVNGINFVTKTTSLQK